jgi:hypothetical protein
MVKHAGIGHGLKVSEQLRQIACFQAGQHDQVSLGEEAEWLPLRHRFVSS